MVCNSVVGPRWKESHMTDLNVENLLQCAHSSGGLLRHLPEYILIMNFGYIGPAMVVSPLSILHFSPTVFPMFRHSADASNSFTCEQCSQG